MKLSQTNRFRIIILLVVWSVISTLYALQIITAEVFRTEIFDIKLVIYYPFVRLFVGYFLILFFVIPLYNIIIKQHKVVKVFGFTLSAIFFGILYSAISVYMLYIISTLTKLNLTESFFVAFINEILSAYHYSIMYFLVFLTILFSIDYMNAHQRALENEKVLDRALSRSKLDALKNQLQPHFLFNALNSISSILDEEKVEAQKMIVDLSNLLRRSLQVNYKEEITLGEELELLDLYLRIEKRRFEHQLIIERQVTLEARKCYILPFILQPIVENAIKYGFSSGINQLKLRIIAEISHDKLHVYISNNGKLKDKFEEGIGLENIRKRLTNVYGKRCTFIIEQQQEYVVASIVKLL